ncbi:MAG: nickel-dependent lactate racemase [Actinomycetota bacterium]|nr:nickel-dependent lactate racemase [Actinomycetota bacterium]
MNINIAYGKENIFLEIPEANLQDIIQSEEDGKSIIDENIVIKSAFKNPIASQKLCELAKGKKNAIILTSDITRPCPSYKFLPTLIKELNNGGIENRNIKIILGLGIHRSHTESEKRKLVGDYVYEKINIKDSNPQDTRLIGRTTFGTPVEVYEEVLGAGILIATGNIEYHYFAGYSGGAKAVMPGICSRNSIQANHKMMLDDKAKAGNFYDNPVRADIEEAGKLVGIDFIFNVILDDHKNIIAAVAGKNNEAYIEGVKKYDAIYKREVKDKADIVITSPGGYPKDLNLYQSQKALENVKNISKEDGEIILVAKCPEGFGEDVFKEWMTNCKNYHLLREALKKNFVLGGHKAVAISKIISSKNVFLYSDFNPDETSMMGFKKVGNIQKHIDDRIARDSNVKITVVPTGRFVDMNSEGKSQY